MAQVVKLKPKKVVVVDDENDLAPVGAKVCECGKLRRPNAHACDRCSELESFNDDSYHTRMIEKLILEALADGFGPMSTLDIRDYSMTLNDNAPVIHFVLKGLISSGVVNRKWRRSTDPRHQEGGVWLYFLVSRS